MKQTRNKTYLHDGFKSNEGNLSKSKSADVRYSSDFLRKVPRILLRLVCVALPKPGDHRREFHGKSDEHRTSALFDLDKLPRSSFVRFETVVEICFISRLFHIISRRKVRANALSTTFKSWGTF